MRRLIGIPFASLVVHEYELSTMLWAKVLQDRSQIDIQFFEIRYHKYFPLIINYFSYI